MRNISLVIPIYLIKSTFKLDR